MSVHSSSSDSSPDATSARPVRIQDLRAMKERGERFAMLTAYDYLSAQILEQSGIPIILVGDSLGMVMLGHESTLPVTLDEMIHHTRAVRRGAPTRLVIADMPFGTFQGGPEQALANATRVMKETGATGVKIEGGGDMVAVTARLVDSGIPVLAHLGLTPQSVNQFGGYRVQGRDDDAANAMVEDARRHQDAGAFAIVLEAIPAALGQRVTDAVDVPTIGIGAGPDTDAQVLVWHDLLGLTGGRLPRFVKQYANLRSEITSAVKTFMHEVADGEYPGDEHVY